MIVIPAIDLKDGKCVRLLQGQADGENDSWAIRWSYNQYKKD